MSLQGCGWVNASLFRLTSLTKQTHRIVEYATREQAQNAVNTLSNQNLMGRLVYVREVGRFFPSLFFTYSDHRATLMSTCFKRNKRSAFLPLQLSFFILTSANAASAPTKDSVRSSFFCYTLADHNTHQGTERLTWLTRTARLNPASPIRPPAVAFKAAMAPAMELVEAMVACSRAAAVVVPLVVNSTSPT